jgi:hypothetical protein
VTVLSSTEGTFIAPSN